MNNELNNQEKLNNPSEVQSNQNPDNRNQTCGEENWEKRNDIIDERDYPHVDVIETRDELIVVSDYVGNIEQNYDMNKRNNMQSSVSDKEGDLQNNEIEAKSDENQDQQSDRTMDRLFREREHASSRRANKAADGLRNFAEDARSNPLA